MDLSSSSYQANADHQYKQETIRHISLHKYIERSVKRLHSMRTPMRMITVQDDAHISLLLPEQANALPLLRRSSARRPVYEVWLGDCRAQGVPCWHRHRARDATHDPRRRRYYSPWLAEPERERRRDVECGKRHGSL